MCLVMRRVSGVSLRMTVIITMSVMNGFREELFSRILGLNGHMNVYSLNGPLYDYDYLRTRIEPIDGITNVTPIIESQSLLSKNGVSNGVLVRGIDPAHEAEVTDVARGDAAQRGTALVHLRK